jgi:hypothetical protein
VQRGVGQARCHPENREQKPEKEAQGNKQREPGRKPWKRRRRRDNNGKEEDRDILRPEESGHR